MGKSCYRWILGLLLLVNAQVFCAGIANQPTESANVNTQNTEQKIIVVGTSWVLAKYAENAISALGYKLVFLVDIDWYCPEIADAIRKSEYYSLDISSYETVEKFLEKNQGAIGPIAAITSFADSKLVTAHRLAKKFGVAGPDPAILLLADKGSVAEMIPEFSPKSLSFRTEKIPLSQIHATINQYGAVIIKPTKGTGALGAFPIRELLSESAIVELMEKALGKSPAGIEWIAQPYIAGTLYSLEGYCKGGQPCYLGFTRRSRIEMTEIADHFPSDDNPLIRKHSKKLYGGIESLIKRSKFQNGYFHCEFLVNNSGAYLIDANFGRIGGGSILEQLAYSFETTPQAIIGHLVSISLLDKKTSSPYLSHPNPKPCLSISYGIQKGGVLKNIFFPKDMKSFHTTIAKTGTYIPSVGTNDYSWIGLISGDPETVLKEIQEIRLEVDGVLLSPYFYIEEVPQ